MFVISTPDRLEFYIFNLLVHHMEQETLNSKQFTAVKTLPDVFCNYFTLNKDVDYRSTRLIGSLYLIGVTTLCGVYPSQIWYILVDSVVRTWREKGGLKQQCSLNRHLFSLVNEVA